MIGIIVVSILMAFGIEAWWDDRQERQLRAELVADLSLELRRNADELEYELGRQRDRVEIISQLLASATSRGTEMSPDSVAALQRAMTGYPTYDPSLGILDLLIQSGALVLLENREVRARLAGLAGVADDYLANQGLVLQVYMHPQAISETGAILYPYSELEGVDRLLSTAAPEVQDVATRYLSFDHFLTGFRNFFQTQ